MPYRDKFTVFANREDFADSDNPGFLKTDGESFLLRREDKSVMEYAQGDGGAPEDYARFIGIIMEDYAHLLGS
jgi:putative selenate reductase